MKGRQRKGFQWTRLPADYYCYRLSYYDSQPENHPTVKVHYGQLVSKGSVIATAEEEGKLVEMLVPYSGVVLEVGEVFLSEKPSHVGNLTVLLIRRCDHQPSSEYSLQCRFCKYEVWAYEYPEEREFRRYDFKDVEDRNGDILWKISLNQNFSPSELLGTIGGSPLQLDFRGRATFLGLGETQDSIILKTRRTICKHEKVFYNVCCHCSEWVEQQTQTSVVAQNNGVVMSGRMLERAQEVVVDKLMYNRKIILILDLDNTILHCLETTVHETSLPPNITDCFHIVYMDTLLVVKMRKYLRYFLAAILYLYEVYIYTKGTREYSYRICQYIRETYTELFEGEKNPEAFTPKRIVSRNEDADLDKKNIDVIFNKKGYVAIMDDRREVWGRPANAVSVKFFRYFDKAPNGYISIPRVDDFYLYFAKDYMVDLHTRFYQNMKLGVQSLAQPDFGTVVRQQRREMLNEYRAWYLLDGDLKKNYHYRRAHEFGIVTALRYEEANIVIYENNCLYKQSKRFENVLELPLVHQSWLEYCYLYNFKFEIDMFRHKEGEDFAKMTQYKRDLFEYALFAIHSKEVKSSPATNELYPELIYPADANSPKHGDYLSTNKPF